MRKPIVSELVRVDFQFQNAQTKQGLSGVTGAAFSYVVPGTTTPVSVDPVASPVNPKTGAAEPGWFFVDVPTTVEGTYKCKATCTGPSPVVIPGSFIVAPPPF